MIVNLTPAIKFFYVNTFYYFYSFVMLIACKMQISTHEDWCNIISIDLY